MKKVFNLGLLISAMVLVFSSCAEKTYTVTFDSQGGTAVAALTNVAEGSIITEPTAPTKEGYFFGGWYKDADCTNVWNFASDVVTSNITLYAKWATNVYTVTFDSQGGTAVAALTNVADGSTITQPTPDPTKAGNAFAGWYKEAGCTNAWNFASDVVNSDITLYAKWTTNVYTVTFDSQGGSAVAALTNVAEGSTINQPPDPTKECFAFDGWYKNAECTNIWNFASDVVNGNITLYAKWVNNNEIPYTEYSLDSTSCHWSLPSSSYSPKGAVVIINSSEELANYISCSGDNNYPQIDFSTHTLLIAYGIQPYAVFPDYKDLQQLSEQDYVMNVDLLSTISPTITKWLVAIVVNKINSNANINLVVTL